jgi:uncharacterized protein
MRPIRSLLIYLAVVFVGGALLAPWIYKSVQVLSTHFAFLENFAQSPFHRYVHRCLLVLALAGLPLLVRRLGIKSWTDLGLSKGALCWGDVARALFIGLLSLAIAAFIAVLSGARSFHSQHSPAEMARHGFSALLTAVVVAILEEILFRGVVFGGLRRAIGSARALIASSSIYALVHFFSRPASPDTVSWNSGLVVLGRMLQGFADVHSLVPGFFSLLLAGILLALLYQRTGALFASIGLHAGWIFWLKWYGYLTDSRADNWFFGTSKLIDGWLAFFLLAALLPLTKTFRRREVS